MQWMGAIRMHYSGLQTGILARHNNLKLKHPDDGLEWCGLPVDYCDVFNQNSHSDGTHSLLKCKLCVFLLQESNHTFINNYLFNHIIIYNNHYSHLYIYYMTY